MKKGNPAGFPAGFFITTELFGHFHAAAADRAAGSAAAAIVLGGRNRCCRGQAHQRCKNEYVFHDSSC